MLIRDLLKEKEGLLIDIEGPLVTRIEGGKVYSDAVKLLEEFSDLKTVLVTNISRRSSKYLSRILKKIGLNFSSDQIVNPTKAAVGQVLDKEFSKPVRVFLISEGGHYEDLVMFDWIEFVREKPIDAILLGANRDITYQELNFAFRCMLEGALLIVLGGDLWTHGSQYDDNGPFLMEGAFAKALEAAVGTEARYVGKPYKEIFLEGISRLNVPKDKIIMIGDSIKTDIVGAYRIGIDAILIDRGGNKERELIEQIEADSEMCLPKVYYSRGLSPDSEIKRIS